MGIYHFQYHELKSSSPRTMDDATAEAIAFGTGIFAGCVIWGPLGLIIGAVTALIIIRWRPIRGEFA